MDHARRGYSLIELTIVSALLGLLAAVAIPRLADPPGAHHQDELATALSVLRTGIDAYRAQHGVLPGQGGAKEFTDQLCRHTNELGRPGAGPGFDLGPYLAHGRIPENPVLGINTVAVVDGMPDHPVGPTAWLYDRTAGTIRANMRGRTPDGRPYFDL